MEGGALWCHRVMRSAQPPAGLFIMDGEKSKDVLGGRLLDTYTMTITHWGFFSHLLDLEK